MQEYEKERVIQAFGGKKGIIDSSVPSLLFVFTQSIAHNLKISLIVALSTAAILSCIRILKKDSLLHSFSGLIGVMICAAFAYFTNSPKGYFAPSITKNAIFLGVYAVGNVLRWPIIGVILGPIWVKTLDGDKTSFDLRHTPWRVGSGSQCLQLDLSFNIFFFTRTI